MKQMALSIAVVLWCAVTGFAGQLQVQVAGIVRSAKTGEPLKSAAVILRSREAELKVSRTTTGADGSFSFSGLSPGQYELTVSKLGYGTYEGSGPIAVLRDSTEVISLAPSLWPQGAISGRVVDWEGEPVSEAEVRAYAVVYQESGPALSMAATAESDDTGEYRLFNLPAGKYVIQASSPPAGSPSGQFYAGTPVAYYPAARAPAQALPVELSWGEDVTRANVSLSRGQSYAVAGAVWDAVAEGPCGRCVVQAVQQDGVYRVSLPQTARVSREGGFVLSGLSPGDYSLVARHGSAAAETQVSIRGRHVEDARLVVGLQQPVTGQIVLENAPEGTDAADWVPELSPVALPEWWPRAEGRIEADLRFAIREVSPARYRLGLKGLPPGAYLKALRAGGQPLATPEILVPGEGGVSGLEAAVGFDGARVQGKVRAPGSTENAQFARALVFLLPQQGQTGFQLPKTAETGADGSFSLGSVAPGSYTLYAIPATAALQIYDPAVQAALGRYVKQVRLDAKETLTVEVPLAPQVR